MKVNYEEIRIEIGNLRCFLGDYAKGILLQMQQADKEFADCWTGCAITFDGLQPEFEWGSIDDIDKSAPLIVYCPIEELTNG